jgi:hypothetical protein
MSRELTLKGRSMADEQKLMTDADPREALQDKLNVALEARHIESVRVMNTTDALAEARASYRKVSGAFLKLEDDLNRCGRRRDFAVQGLYSAIGLIKTMHRKTAPSHGDGLYASCPICTAIRSLNHELALADPKTQMVRT